MSKNPKINLGKTRDSRTRGQAKAPATETEAENIKAGLGSEHAGFVDYLLAKGYSSITAYRYTKDVMTFETWADQANVPIEGLSYGDVLAYIQEKRRVVEQKTIGSALNSLRHYLDYQVQRGVLTYNPVLQVNIKGIKRRKLYDVLEKPALESLYHHYPPESQHQQSENCRSQNWYQASQLAIQRNKVMLGLLVYQGLNTSELTQLKGEDLDLKGGRIFIAGSRRSNERYLKLEAVQVVELMEYTMKTRPAILELTNKTSDKLFLSTGQGPRLSNALQQLTRQLRAMNSQFTSLKQLRTSVIVQWLKQYNLREVQYMAGHRFVSSTENYLINDLDNLQEDIGKFHPIG